MALKNKQFIYCIFVGFILSVFQLTFAQGVPQKGMLWVYWGNSLDVMLGIKGFYILTLFLKTPKYRIKTEFPLI